MSADKKSAAGVKEKRRPGRVKQSYVLAAALAIGATVWVLSGVLTAPEPADPGSPAGEAAKARQKTPQVRIAELSATERTRRIVVTGRTNAIKDAEIKAETAGQVVARPARKGSTVDKDTVLLELALDDRAARLDDAKAAVASAQINFNAAQKLQRKQYESEVRLAEAESVLATAKAQLAAIQLDIARTKIRAPIDGYIETLLPGPGDYVSAGEMVAMVVDLDPLRVVVNVTERNVGDITTDDLATVRLSDGREVGGTVHYVSKIAEETTRTFRVDIWIDNPQGAISAGLTAEVTLDIGKRAAHKIASSALTLDDRGVLGVRAVDDTGVVRFHKVEIVEDTPSGTWVSGLPETVRVITVGHEFVSDGQEVDVTTGVVAEPEKTEPAS